jgi:hypothetical protein
MEGDYADSCCYDSLPCWNAQVSTCVAPTGLICAVVGQSDLGREVYGCVWSLIEEGNLQNLTDSTQYMSSKWHKQFRSRNVKQALCVQVSVLADATYCLEDMSQADMCGGTNGIHACPHKGGKSTIGCHEHLLSWNDTARSCIATKKATCAIVGISDLGANVYGCVWSTQ